jgi:hypothetical protein
MHDVTDVHGRRRPGAWLALLLCASLGSCCSLARLFCGPDTSPWVPVSFRTSREALQTFLEAVRREDKKRVYESLGERLKRDLGVAGEMELEVFYERLKEKVTYLHVLGYAEVKKTQELTRDAVEYELDAEGYRIVARVRAYAYWSVAAEETNESGEKILQDYGDYVPRLDALVKTDREVSLTVTIKDPPAVPFEQLREIKTGIEWKLDDLRGLEP